jgi:hypothetical protein
VFSSRAIQAPTGSDQNGIPWRFAREPLVIGDDSDEDEPATQLTDAKISASGEASEDSEDECAYGGTNIILQPAPVQPLPPQLVNSSAASSSHKHQPFTGAIVDSKLEHDATFKQAASERVPGNNLGLRDLAEKHGATKSVGKKTLATNKKYLEAKTLGFLKPTFAKKQSYFHAQNSVTKNWMYMVAVTDKQSPRHKDVIDAIMKTTVEHDLSTKEDLVALRNQLLSQMNGP